MVGNNACPEDSPPHRTAGTNSSSRRNERNTQTTTYGYHNTFHTHALPSITEDSPPSYDHAVASSRLTATTDSAESDETSTELPQYSCSVQLDGPLAVHCELATPFLDAPDNRWHDIYAVLHGTQLSIYKAKLNGPFSSKHKPPTAGRLIRTYSLQHAEVGVAVDWRQGAPVPKSAFVKLIPPAARLLLWEADPQLFEPMREWVIRLRLETEQLLLCAESQDSMLTWVEQLCAAIDIAPPIEDRSEPRYRSLPRQNRRQREIEGLIDHTDNLADEEASRRFVEQQERLIRRLYPHLATYSGQDGNESLRDHADPESRYPQASQHVGGTGEASQEDPDAEDLDPADVTEGLQSPMSRPTTSTSPTSSELPASESQVAASTYAPMSASFDPKTSPSRPPPSPASQLRYRKRCAPILLSSSPRVSDIVFHNNRRLRIDTSKQLLVPFEMSPPRYNIGSWKGTKSNMVAVLHEENETSVASSSTRPKPDTRGISSESNVSTSTSCSLEADGASSAPYIDTSDRDLHHCVHIDGSAERENLHIHRVDSEHDGTLPTSPVPSETINMGKGKAILVVRRMKGPHLADVSRRGKGGQVGNAQTPVAV